MKTKANTKAIDLGVLQVVAEQATRNLKSAATKLVSAEQTFNEAEQAHFTAVKSLNDGMRAISGAVKPRN